MVTPPRPLNRTPIASPAPSGPVQQQPISYQPIYSFGNWFIRQRATTLMSAWADLRMLPNVNVPYMDDNNNVLGARESGTTFTSAAVDNVLFGYQAGLNISSGYQNTFIGSLTGQRNTSGYNNTAVGRGSLLAETTGANNIGIGHAAIFHGLGNYACIGIGNVAGGGASDGTNGTFTFYGDSRCGAIGEEAGKASTEGPRSDAWCIGYRAPIPNKDRVFAIGGASFAAVTTPGKVWAGFSRSICSASSTAATLTTTNIVSGFCQRTSATSSGSDSFPSAADIIVAGPGGQCMTPTSMRWRFLNTSTVSRDLSTGVGVVISGDRTVLASQGTEWLIEITNSNTSSASAAITVYRMSS